MTRGVWLKIIACVTAAAFLLSVAEPVSIPARRAEALSLDDILNGGWKDAAKDFVIDNKVIDKIIDKVIEKIPGVGNLSKVLGVIAKTLTHRLISHFDAAIIEAPTILMAGELLVLEGLIAMETTKALKDKAYWAELVPLGAIIAAEAVLYGTLSSIYDKQNSWYKAIKEDYKLDHEPLAANAQVYRDLSPRYASTRTTLASGTGASFPAGNVAAASVFDSISPGYRGASADLYITNYKTLAENWKKYSDAQKSVSDGEGSELAGLKETVDNLAKASLETGTARNRLGSNDRLEGYRQAIEARAQVNAFTAQQASNLRNDIARQIDARARAALDKQQRRTDLHWAFGRALKDGGAAWTAGTGY